MIGDQKSSSLCCFSNCSSRSDFDQIWIENADERKIASLTLITTHLVEASHWNASKILSYFSCLILIKKGSFSVQSISISHRSRELQAILTSFFFSFSFHIIENSFL